MTKRENLIINVAVEIDRLLTDGIEIHTNSPIHEKLNQALRQPLVMESVCSCSKCKGIDHDEDGKAYCIDCGNYL